jgi:hypothetical protein
MAKAKYKEYVEKMISLNQALFDQFKTVHDQYSLDNETHQQEFNRVGEKVMKIIKEYEAKLCHGSENKFNQFTPQLAEKFMDEIRHHFPLIDHVGIITESVPSTKIFNLKKIRLG